jgi:hypothetical protein
MSEVIHDTQEYWRPPAGNQPLVSAPAGSPILVEACDDCGTEFMVGARFCYVCGAPRLSQENSARERDWISYLEFHNIWDRFLSLRRVLALSTGAFIAFFIGVGCLIAALSVGFVYAVQNFADFQAIQYWRVEWLLAAVAAFLAGMMLKRPDQDRS